MTPEEYKKALADIEAEKYRKIKQLSIQYALDTKKYKVGDIIKSNRVNVIIKISKITVYSPLYELPMAVYHGIELKKDLTPKKNTAQNAIYGDDQTELIKSGNE